MRKKPILKNRRIKKAIQLYLREEISLGKAVEIAGINRIDLMNLIRERDPSVIFYTY
ncbi:MAG: UPF0175 family protein [Candidatus Heimdallarchaeota archaeon]